MVTIMFYFARAALRGLFLRISAIFTDLLDPQLQAVFNQIDRVWGDLARFVKNEEHKVCLPCDYKMCMNTLLGASLDPVLCLFPTHVLHN